MQISVPGNDVTRPWNGLRWSTQIQSWWLTNSLGNRLKIQTHIYSLGRYLLVEWSSQQVDQDGDKFRSVRSNVPSRQTFLLSVYWSADSLTHYHHIWLLVSLLHQVSRNKATSCLLKPLQRANERPSALHSVIVALPFRNALSQSNPAVFLSLLTSCVSLHLIPKS